MKTLSTVDSLIEGFVLRAWDSAKLPDRPAFDSSGVVCSAFFQQHRLYSYGYHYLMAKYVAPTLILINSKKSSATTEKHKGKIRLSASHQRVSYITVPVVDPTSADDHLANKQYIVDSIEAAQGAMQRSRKYKDLYRNDINNLRADYDKYCNYERTLLENA